MSEPALSNRVRARREAAGLSQQGLADFVGVSRQAVIAIEAGRQVPSTALGLRLAHALGCTVEDLFSLGPGEGIEMRIAPAPKSDRARVVVGEVRGEWVAHPMPPDPMSPADGLLAGRSSASKGVVTPLADIDHLRRNVIVSGCAPLLGALAQRVGRRFFDARATWIHAGSHRALELLQEGLVHVAGIHLTNDIAGEDNLTAIRARFARERMLVVNLTRWREGFIVSRGNPLEIRSAQDLLRPGLRVVKREEGSQAHKLLMNIVARESSEYALLTGPIASGHAEVAQLVRYGAADVGIAIESVALAAGLDFVPLTDERFDLVVPAALADAAPVSRLFHALQDPAFKREVEHLPGYDADLVGQVTTLEAA